MPASDIPEYKPPKTDAAPKGRPAKGSSTKSSRAKRSPPKPTMPVEEIREDLLDFFIGVGLIAFHRNEVDGIIIIGGAPDTIDAWCNLAEKNPYVHMALQKFCSTNDLTKVLSTTLPMVLAIAANHGIAVPTPRPIAYYRQAAETVLEEQDIANDGSENPESPNGVPSGTAAPIP